jgi:hypothetical protein
MSYFMVVASVLGMGNGVAILSVVADPPPVGIGVAVRDIAGPAFLLLIFWSMVGASALGVAIFSAVADPPHVGIGAAVVRDIAGILLAIWVLLSSDTRVGGWMEFDPESELVLRAGGLVEFDDAQFSVLD